MSDYEKAQSTAPQVLFGGSCACSRITYTSTSVPTASVNCHCVTCRKLGGGPYQCFPEMRSKQVTFYDHKENLRYEGLPTDSIGGITFLRLTKAGERAFCADCHAPLAIRHRHEPDVIGLALGSVDEDTIKDDKVKTALKPKAHIFTNQTPWWVDVVGKDGLKAYKRFSDGYEEGMKVWEGKEG